MSVLVLFPNSFISLVVLLHLIYIAAMCLVHVYLDLHCLLFLVILVSYTLLISLLSAILQMCSYQLSCSYFRYNVILLPGLIQLLLLSTVLRYFISIALTRMSCLVVQFMFRFRVLLTVWLYKLALSPFFAFLSFSVPLYLQQHIFCSLSLLC